MSPKEERKKRQKGKKRRKEKESHDVEHLDEQPTAGQEIPSKPKISKGISADSDNRKDLEKDAAVEQTSKSAPPEKKEQDVHDTNHESGKKRKLSSASKEERAKRRDERKKLLAQVPTTDENGIAYTKQQLRRMAKRIARGLDPIESEEEKAKRLREEAELRREEEAELAGIIYKRPKDKSKDEDEIDGGDESNETIDHDHVDASEAAVHEEEEMNDENVDEEARPPQKKKKRSKAVPDDYICAACKNKHTPIHWIYDCPSKVTMRGTNQVAKRLRGIHDPDARKVFVSGLPFDATRKDVEKLFAACGKIAHCRLIKFEDTGRCTGQAYLTFDTMEGTNSALKLSGTMIENEIVSKNKKGTKEATDNKRKELKLKVTKALNRIASKHGQISSKGHKKMKQPSV